MILSLTSQSIELVLDGLASVSEMEFVTAFADMTTTSFTPGTVQGTSNGTTDVKIVPAPGTNTQRQVKYISIYNADTASHQVTVKLDDGGTERRLFVSSLEPGQTLSWARETGWVKGTSVAANFLDLLDTPSSYTGAGGEIVKVNATVSGLEFSNTMALADGTVAAPALSFASDPDSGIFLSSVGRVAIASGGQTAGTFFFSGNATLLFPNNAKITWDNAAASATLPILQVFTDDNTYLDSFSDIIIRSNTAQVARFVGTARLQLDVPPQVPSFTVATVPSATPAGQIIYVSDETGGATLAFSDGTNWRRTSDRAIIA